MKHDGDQFGLHYPDDDRPEYSEYRTPNDEPMRHQPDTNVQFDWYRHLPKDKQTELSPEGDHAKAWAQHTSDIDTEYRYGI